MVPAMRSTVDFVCFPAVLIFDWRRKWSHPVYSGGDESISMKGSINQGSVTKSLVLLNSEAINFVWKGQGN